MNFLTAAFKFLQLQRPSNGSGSIVRQINTAGFPLQFKSSPALWAEPLKPKKRVDPTILKAREERKKKKVEKMIRKRLKLNRQLKPITENEIPLCLVYDLKERTRVVEVPEKVTEERILLLKEWAKIQYRESRSDILLIDRLIYAQQEALNELRLESEELYQAAVKIDEKLIPLEYSGPTETSSMEDYNMPDGEYLDISKNWTS